MNGGRGRSLLVAILLVAGALAVLDIVSDPGPVPVIAVVGCAAGGVLFHVVGGRRRTWRDHGLLLMVTSLVLVAATEVVFRVALVKRRVPTTDEEFERVVASAWPRSIPEAAASGTTRIAGLCDSFGTAGDESNFHYLLESRLRDHGVEVVNLSVPGYSPRDELELLRQAGSRFNPDLVVHGFFVGNDFVDPTGDLVTCYGVSFRLPGGIVGLRPRNLAVIKWARHTLRVQWERMRVRAEPEAAAEKTFTASTFMGIARHRASVFRIHPPPETRWAHTIAILDEIRATASTLGARYVVVIHPSQTQVEHGLWADVVSGFDLEESAYDLDLPQRFLRDYCASRGIPCLDLLPAFREAGGDGGLYRLHDTHYNQAGNALAAERMAAFLGAATFGDDPPRDVDTEGR